MLELKAQKREIFGKQVKNLLKDGFVPVEVYGNDSENIHLQVSFKELKKIYKEAGENSLISIVIDGEKNGFPVLIKDIQFNHVSDNIIHADFYLVNMKEKIEAEIPLVFVGESPAVKEFGGVLVKAVDQIEIEALPLDIPHSINVDLSVLVEMHQSIHVKDLEIPKGVRLLTDPETVVVKVTEVAKEEEVVAPVVEEVPETTPVAEVIVEEKKK